MSVWKDLFGNEIAPVNVRKPPREIIEKAVREYDPVKVVLMFSGGYDSLVNSHISANILRDMGIDFVVYHGDTTIGIPETQKYVKDICELYGWMLSIRKPPKRSDWYDKLIERFGFPGPTKQSHQIMYRRLKERALNQFVTYECKSRPHARENVLLLSGIRRDESKIRQGYTEEVVKVDSKVWVNPIFWMSAAECLQYRRDNDMPLNMVKELMCISGECLCGSFADNGEFQDLKRYYPETAKKIEALHEVAKSKGFPWPWSCGPTEWWKNHPKGQIDMFMCVGCEEKRNAKLAP